MTVLFVRRDPCFAFEIGQELSNERIVSHFSSTTDEACSMLRQQKFSCVVMDLHLETEHTEFFRRYLQLRYPDITTLCILNHSPNACVGQFSAPGVDFVVSPSLGPRDLAVMVRYLLDSSVNGGPTELTYCEAATNA